MMALYRNTAVSPSERRPQPTAVCQPRRPLSRIMRMCRSRWLGAVPALGPGTAVARGGTATAAGGSGWRAATAR